MERLLKYFKPEKYVLNLFIDKFKKALKGEVKVFGEVLNETVKFHAVKLKILEVLVFFVSSFSLLANSSVFCMRVSSSVISYIRYLLYQITGFVQMIATFCGNTLFCRNHEYLIG